MLTGPKFDISFLLGLPFSREVKETILALSGKILCVVLVFMAFVKGWQRELAANFIIGGIESFPTAFFIFMF